MFEKKQKRAQKIQTNKMRVTLVRSTNRRRQSHKASVKGLGLRRINHSVVLPNRPEIWGMVDTVYYLLKVEEVK